MAQETYDRITLQLAAGFGQGAGTMLATGEAVEAAIGAYSTSLQARASTWSDYSLQTIEYARALGRLSAAKALSHGRCVIELADVEYGLDRVQQNTAWPLGVCRITSVGGRRGNA